MTAPAPPRRQRLLFGIVVLVACAVVAETSLRVFQRGPRWIHPVYLELSRDFDELEALLADLQRREKRGTGPRYYEEFLYAATPFSSKHLNYTDYYSARLTPDSVPLPRAEHVVWAFGGSTMQNEETVDRLTIANTWAREFNRRLGPTHVKNFGMGGFNSSFELIKFQKLLREVDPSELPTIAIFYDGYNDAWQGYQYGPGRMQGDLTLKLRALVERDDLSVGLYGWSRLLSRHSKLWERSAGSMVQQLLFPLPQPRFSEEDLAATIRIYVRNVEMSGATCEALGIRCLFLLQPLVVTKTPLSETEREVLARIEAHPRFGVDGVRFARSFYATVARRLAMHDDFIDASGVLDGRDRPDFYDFGHTGALTPPVIGEKTADAIVAALSSAERRLSAPSARE